MPSPATSLVVVGRIPREPPRFVVRDELARLRRALEPPAAAVVVTGLRGAGKTHLAAAHARSLFDSGRGLVGWVNAETPDSTLSGLADIAERLGVADRDGDSAVSARRLRDHLSGGTVAALLVFDNATDADHLRDLLPTGGRTRILITSVDRSFAAFGEAVDVTCFTRPESVRFLADSTGLGDDGDAEQVAEDLGDLPLALSAAAATMVGRRLGYAQYRQLLHDSPLPTALRRTAGHDYPRSVVQAISLCVETTEGVTGDYELAADVAWLLGAMAMLSPGGVHRSLFATSPRRVDEALERCVAGSLLSWSTSGEALIMHRLVGRVLRERGSITQPISLFRRAARAFRDRTPAARSTADLVRSALAIIMRNTFPPSQAWARRQDGAHLVDQIDALWDTGMVHGSTRKHAVAVIAVRRWAVEQLIESADTARALTLAQDVVVASEQILGGGHPDTYTARTLLARAYSARGRLDEAATRLEADLADAVRIFGPANPVTLVLRFHLADTYTQAGRLDTSSALHTENIAHSRRVFGPDAHETLNFRSGLAQVHLSAGNLADAIAVFEDLLPVYLRVLGADHVDSFFCLHKLARAYGAAGRTDRAVPLLRENLDDAMRIFGADHPVTLACRNNLAEIYEAVGRAEDAVRLGEANLVERLRVLGPEHPDTLITRHNLACALHTAGRLADAIALFEANVADFHRILGPDHPITSLTQGGLAIAYSATGRRDEAIAIQEAALRDRLRILGPDHPDTLKARNNFADALAMREPGRAIPLLETNVSASARVLGLDHPDTLSYRHNLAAAYHAAGRIDDALVNYQATLTDRLRILGPDHHATLASRDSLAAAYRSAGDLDTAIDLSKANLAEYHRALPGYPRLRSTRTTLADTLRDAGRFEEAIPLYQANIDQQEVGPDDPLTARSVDGLALAYHAAGRFEETVRLFETVFDRVIQALGSDHPLADEVRDHLAAARRTAENHRLE
ncbi:tetratricopeptide repeat protein [Nocardia asiatica]|uniref:tetratricopeptide repeat protein n=1 Tax=Nocardia asiatica TaxID=209252 RepID=UPI002453ACFC|nr:tetratricopeptide repeat protein [Nocardia asiatica]